MSSSSSYAVSRCFGENLLPQNSLLAQLRSFVTSAANQSPSYMHRATTCPCITEMQSQRRLTPRRRYLSRGVRGSGRSQSHVFTHALPSCHAPLQLLASCVIRSLCLHTRTDCPCAKRTLAQRAQGSSVSPVLTSRYRHRRYNHRHISRHSSLK
jgi:hypothetical protein